uniref:Potassium channel subfamily K member 17-like n=1 Tax=Gouania willdenowi TaxID=441366 RepID=A0A8C5NDN7_GOUWI
MGIKEVLNLGRVPSILMLGTVYVIYVLLGGLVFWKVEGDLGKKDISKLLMSKQKLLETYPCLNIQDVSKVGLSLRGNYTTDGFWKFTSSAVFAATVVTTIGYGNMSPATMPGQIFCVFFALIGIPLNLLVLNRVGKYMLRCTRFFIHLVSCLCGTVLFFIVPMIVFQQQEGWTFSEAIYYCFITLSTIGFGDFVADNNPDKTYPTWYSILMACWIFFGLAWLALLINLSIDILERLNNHFRSGLCCKPQDEDSGSAEGSQGTQVEDENEIKEYAYPQYPLDS